MAHANALAQAKDWCSFAVLHADRKLAGTMLAGSKKPFAVRDSPDKNEVPGRRPN
jgi:hypothetical protein